MTPSQFRQALETLAFTDGSRMVVQLASGQNISGRFQTMLTNGNGLQAYGARRVYQGRCPEWSFSTGSTWLCDVRLSLPRAFRNVLRHMPMRRDRTKRGRISIIS